MAFFSRRLRLRYFSHFFAIKMRLATSRRCCIPRLMRLMIFSLLYHYGFICWLSLDITLIKCLFHGRAGIWPRIFSSLSPHTSSFHDDDGLQIICFIAREVTKCASRDYAAPLEYHFSQYLSKRFQSRFLFSYRSACRLLIYLRRAPQK